MTRRSDNGPLALLPFLLILGVTLALATAPQWMSLPVPQGAVPLTEAMFSLDGGDEVAVTLPHRWPSTTGLGPARGTYRIAVDLPTLESPLLLVPAAQHALTARLDGLRLWGSDRQSWGEAALSSAYVLSMPPTQQGRGVFEIVIERASGAVPGHLSPLYLVDQRAVAPTWGWLWTLASNGARIAVIGLQTLVILGIAIVWFSRRHDPIFIWLALIGFVSSALLVADALPTQLFSINGQSMLVFALAAFGAMALGLALSIADIPRPLWLRLGTFGLPLALIAGINIGLLPPFIAALAGFMVAVSCQLAAAIVLSLNTHARQWDRALLAAAFALAGWYGLRDIGVLSGALDAGVLLTPHLRPLTILAVFILLMRRLANSLEQIDGVNETLRQKLAAQESELSALHLHERLQLAKAAREDERGRLMRDLHDGLSGHLVSIIALTQARTANPSAIERTARSALDDLRLVINSLDLDDGDLILALASLRERLEPQLRRLGAELDWSMEKLPEVTGITPSNALAILRILQEAITNALKHGEPSRIAIHGATGADGKATIVVRNGIRAADATEIASGQGHGLINITRRAQKLGGDASFDCNSRYATLTLVLPTHLQEC